MRNIIYSTMSVIVLAAIVTVATVKLGQGESFAGVKQNMVSIYVDGQSKTVVTEASTVGEALKRAGVKLSAEDRSEPSVDAEITSDNFNINVYRSQPVMIVDGSSTRIVSTSYKTPRQIVEHAGYKTDPADQFDKEITRDILDNNFVGLSINIRRAKLVHFNLYGTLVNVRTASVTVADLLEERRVTLSKGDKLSVSIDSPIKQGMIIDLSRSGQHLYTVKEPIPFTEKQIQDVNQPIGYRNIRTPGKNGVRVATYQGVRASQTANSKPIQTLIETQPIQQVVVVGAKVTPTPVTTKFTGDLSEAFARLRACESGGNYAINTGNGYYGAYQYDISTWAGYGGYERADLAPPQVQDQKALITYQARGWSPWPSCGAGL